MTNQPETREEDAFELELFGLIARYEDDVLDGGGLARLNHLLITKPSARDIFNDVCLQSLSLGEALSVGDAPAQGEEQLQSPRKIIAFPSWGYAAAAAVVVLLSTAFFLSRHDVPTLDPVADATPREIVAEPLAMRVQGQSGAVDFLAADGTPITGDAAQALSPGKTVATRGPDSGTVLVYPDGTRLELGPDTLASFAQGDRKLVLLDRGQLNASVQPQPAGQPFGVRTPHLELTVVGTEFSVVVEDDDTSVRVLEGNVHLERLSDRSEANLLAGQEVAVARDGELLVVSLPPSSDVASSNGAESSTSSEPGAPPVLNLNIAKGPVRGTVTLSKPAVVRGRILTSDGRPSPNARVSIHANETSKEALAEGFTDSEGRFEIKVGVFGEFIARSGSAIKAKVAAASGRVTNVGDLAPGAE